MGEKTTRFFLRATTNLNYDTNTAQEIIRISPNPLDDKFETNFAINFTTFLRK